MISLETVGSTNDEALNLARTGAPDGTAIIAREQTGGRGRRGRVWASPRGNLYLSLLLRPGCRIQAAAELGLVMAVALAETLERLAGPLPIQVKWPNDVLVGAKKIAGILLESQLDLRGNVEILVIGVGVNLTSHPKQARYPATDLAASGVDCTPEGCARTLLMVFEDWRQIWSRSGFEPIRRAWLDRAAGLDQPCSIAFGDEPIDGVFRDLDKNGALVLELPGGERVTVGAGEIVTASPSNGERYGQ